MDEKNYELKLSSLKTTSSKKEDVNELPPWPQKKFEIKVFWDSSMASLYQ